MRDNLEDQAEAEGRSADSLWTEAIEGGEARHPVSAGRRSDP